MHEIACPSENEVYVAELLKLAHAEVDAPFMRFHQPLPAAHTRGTSHVKQVLVNPYAPWPQFISSPPSIVKLCPVT